MQAGVNLESDMLSTPDFFWDNDEWEPGYVHARKYLDVDNRVNVLNKRVEVLSAMFNMLRNQLEVWEMPGFGAMLLLSRCQQGQCFESACGGTLSHAHPSQQSAQDTRHVWMLRARSGCLSAPDILEWIMAMLFDCESHQRR